MWLEGRQKKGLWWGQALPCWLCLRHGSIGTMGSETKRLSSRPELLLLQVEAARLGFTTRPCGDLVLHSLVMVPRIVWNNCQHTPKWMRYTDILIISRRGNAPCLFLEDRSHPPFLQHRRGPISQPGATLPSQLGGLRKPEGGWPLGKRQHSLLLAEWMLPLNPEASRNPSWQTWSQQLGGRCFLGPWRAGMRHCPASPTPRGPMWVRLGDSTVPCPSPTTACSPTPSTANSRHTHATGSLPEMILKSRLTTVFP